MPGLRIYSREEALGLELPWPDVYFEPGYGGAVEASDDGRWQVAVWEPGPIIFPHVLTRQDDGSIKASSPYGYAGTWAPAEVTHEAWSAFRAELRVALAAEAGVRREFQRISGLVPGRARLLEADPELVGRHNNDTVAIDLSCGYEACWKAAESRSRTKTRKARKKGYHRAIRPAELDDLLPGGAFRELYDMTMRRVEARDYYLFGDEYYRRLLEGLGERLGLIEVRSEAGEVGAAGIFMERAPRLHLHLVGSTREAQRDGAGNLLYDGVIEWGAARGDLEVMHVGGGQAINDGMFYFKKSFGGFRVPFWVANGDIAPTSRGASA